MLDVIDVMLHTGLDGGVPPQPVHLGPAGDARPDLMLHHIQRHILLESLHIVGDLRPRAHQAHVPFEHVEELRQLVQGQLAHERPEPGLTPVVVRAPAGVLPAVHMHGPELVHIEPFFPQPYTLLLEDDRSRRGQLHSDRT